MSSPSVLFNSAPGVPRAHPNASLQSNPVVFLDIEIAGQSAGRVVIELFANTVPLTAENFRQFCTGEAMKNSLPIGYKGSQFHRILKDFMIQGGDFLLGNGEGVTSIYGGLPFQDENFSLSHDRAGLLSMANSGPNSNGCQFFITCSSCEWLDGKHVVFGQVIDGMLTVRKMEAVPVGANGKPNLAVTVSQCGEL